MPNISGDNFTGSEIKIYFFNVCTMMAARGEIKAAGFFEVPDVNINAS